ncbi:MAG: TonB family protein [Verrucomicrobiota bacterium]
MSQFAKRLSEFSWVPVQIAGALLLTFGFLAFLVALRILDKERTPDQEIRVVEVLPEFSMPAPPPPPEEIKLEPNEPPPPQRVPLPQLEIEIESTAPPLRARIDPKLDLTMKLAMFELEVDPPKPTPSAPKATLRPVSHIQKPQPKPKPTVRTTFDAGELDSKPRLRSAPSMSFPRELLKEGIREGTVVVEVEIDTSGRVSVRRVLSSNHPRFTEIARSVAARSRFSTPTKDGKPVKAIFRWPLVIRP